MSSKAPKRKASSTEADANNGKPCIDFQPGDRWQLKEDDESSDSQPSDMKSANGRSLRSRSSRNSAKKDAPAINGEAEETGGQKDTSKAAANRTPSKKKAVDEAATKVSEETSKKANDETAKSENGRASLKRKKSSAEDDQKEKAPPSKTKKVSNSSKKVREEIEEKDGEDEESDSHEEDEVQEIDGESDSKNGEEEDDEIQEISEVVADKASPKEVVVESSESSQDSEKDSEGKVVELDSSIEMLDDEDDDAESLDTPSSASEPKDEASKDGSSSETSKDKTVDGKSKTDDDIEIINVKDDDGKKDEESDSECQIITEDEPSDTVRSDAQNFPCPTLSEKDVSLSAGYPYYNSLKEKITNFKAGDFKPVKFPHTGTLLLGENEVIIESPSLLVPLLIKEADEFPKPEGDDKKSDDDAIVIKPSIISRKNFFQSSVGQFLINLGTSRVQEWYHRDMKRAKLKQLKSNKPTEENLEKAVELHDKRHDELKEINAIFNFRQRQCKFCSFKSESQFVMEQHYLTPHLSPRREYKCNFCDFLTRDPGTIVFHFEAMHGKKARLDANITFHECVFCSFQSHLKTKVNCHMNRCRKHFIPSQNLAPPFDFEFPGVTTKPVTIADVVGHRRMLMNSKNQQQGMSGDNSAYARKKLASVLNRLSGGQSSYDVKNPNLMKQLMTGQSQLPGSSIQLPPGIVITRPRGGGPIQQIRPVGRFPVPRGAVPSSRPQYLAKPGRPPLNASITASQLSSAGISITPVTRPGGAPRTGNLPGVRNITLTPIGNAGNSLYPNAAGSSGLVGQPQTRMPLNMRPLGPVAPYQRLNTPPSQVVKGSSGNTFVVCEICDSYIKDLEELRTHMNWVHKVKIHPKMLVSRPPLNCQKCQWRFFTDQGLERHLLGAHGLVTTNMQEMANKNQDGGRCIICGAVFTYKLVSHMTTVHKVTLKPAHLSYKCTVCTATFTLYRLFESHVYNVHSNSAKRNAEAASSEEPVTSEPPAKKPAVAQGPKKCRDCNIITDNMDEHIIKNHIKKLSVPLCRIEKCKKCLYKSDEMLLIRMSDFGLEEESSSGSEEGSSEEGSSEEEEDDEDGKDSG